MGVEEEVEVVGLVGLASGSSLLLVLLGVHLPGTECTSPARSWLDHKRSVPGSFLRQAVRRVVVGYRCM